MRRGALQRLAAMLVVAAGALWCPLSPVAAQAQNVLVQRAMDLENAGKWRDAVIAWRTVLSTGDVAQGILGLERVYQQMGQDDSVLPPLDSALARAPKDRVLHGAQLRVLRSLGRDRDARAAFAAWTQLVPNDPTPYREYAQQLLNDGRATQADTVLQEASQALGGTKTLVIEVAQLRAALGLWGQAGPAWREALLSEMYLEQAALYSLAPAPRARRDSIRAALRAPPMKAPLIRTLGALELAWGAPREGWRVLAALTAADSAYPTWSDFADDAERLGAWLPARDALVAMMALQPSPVLTVRAANAALNGGEAASAVELLAKVAPTLKPAVLRTQVLPLQVRALSALGRGAEVEALVARHADSLDAGTRHGFVRQLAWAWIRSGQIEKARAALVGATGDDEDEVTAWLALYDGDLKKARAGLKRPTESTTQVVLAIAFLSRTKADSARGVGAAFLALARADTNDAARRFERSADELPDAAALLLGVAARLRSARRDDAGAIGLWQRIVTEYAAAPEAAEADLEWGRTLRRHGDATGATTRFEHLILTYPRSALVPQARRELDGLRTGAAE